MWYRFHLGTYFCLDVIFFAWLIDKCSTCILKKNLEVQPPLQMWFIHMFKKVLDSNKYQGKPLQWPFPNGTLNWHQGWDSRSKSPTKWRVMFQCSPREFIQNILKLKTLLALISFSFWGMLQFQKLWLPYNRTFQSPLSLCQRCQHIMAFPSVPKASPKSPIAPTAGSWKSPKNSMFGCHLIFLWGGGMYLNKHFQRRNWSYWHV